MQRNAHVWDDVATLSHGFETDPRAAHSQSLWCLDLLWFTRVITAVPSTLALSAAKMAPATKMHAWHGAAELWFTMLAIVQVSAACLCAKLQTHWNVVMRLTRLLTRTNLL